MTYPAALIVLAVILGSIGQANHNAGLRELADLMLIAGLIMLGRALWQRHTTKRNEQRTPGL